MHVEKLDVTVEGDRKKALAWNVDILVNNAGVLEGGSVVTGIYSASKHAIEAIAETMSMELQEFGVEVATINPGPFLTGFNDRGFQTWESWEDEPSERLFDYSKLAFPGPQFDRSVMIETMAKVVAGDVHTYRNLEPQSMIDETKKLIEAPWTKNIKEGLGTRAPQVKKCYEMKPETSESKWVARERDGASV